MNNFLTVAISPAYFNPLSISRFQILIAAPNSSGYLDDFSAETMLVLVILCIISVSLLFFFMTLYKKINRIQEIRKKELYQITIDDLLFKLLFSEARPEEVINSSPFQENRASKLFQQLTIKALIGLHHNYSGIYSTKLEQFFAQSGLAAYSLEKLNSENWSHVVEGIRDLSSLNYLPAYPRIVSYKNHKNKFVKTEVLLGMIKLKGISELIKFKNSKVFFNDWVQSNILFVIKKYKIPAPENITELLESKNKTILLLTVRLINYYNLPEHYTILSQLSGKMEDPILKNEVDLLLEKIEQLQ